MEECVDHPQGESDSNRTVPLILERKFFKIVHRDKDNVQAKCTHCKQKIKGRIDASTNFLNHLKIKGHPAKEYTDYKAANAKNPRKRRLESDGNDQPASTSKKLEQSTLTRGFSRTSQLSADTLITSFVVETMSPLSIVEHPAFKKLIDGINKIRNPVTVMTRKTLRSKVDAMYSQMLTYFLERLESTEHVCTTADTWSSSKRNFLEVTVHWINKDLERESAALACRRFRGSHTYDKIAELIHEVHSEFKLGPKQVLKTTTDNASNMVKAFTVFSEPQDLSPPNDLDDDDEDELVITGILEDGYNSEGLLPEHQRCASQRSIW